MAQWLSWLERRPVTAEVESSSLFWVVQNASHFEECRSGGTGRRPGLKIPWVVIPVPVRFRSTAAFGTEPDWFCSFFVNSVANFVSSCHNNCKRSRLPAKPESASFICSFISFYASAAFSSCSFSLASSSPSSTKRDGSTG